MGAWKQEDGQGDRLGDAERWSRMADGGDVDGLWQVVTETPGSLIDREAVFRLLLKSAGVAARNDPRFADDVFGHLVGFAAWLAMTAQFNAALLARGQFARGVRPGAAGITGLDPDVLRQVLELQQHVAGLLLARAQVDRLRRLTAGRAEKGRATGPGGSDRRPTGTSRKARTTPDSRTRRTGANGPRVTPR